MIRRLGIPTLLLLAGLWAGWVQARAHAAQPEAAKSAEADWQRGYRAAEADVIVRTGYTVEQLERAAKLAKGKNHATP